MQLHDNLVDTPVTAANHGRGACAEVLDNGRRCPQAAYGDSDKCYWHGKLAQRLARRLATEDKRVPRTRGR
ncbi:MAG: hypothetical protein ABSC31_13635 [Acidimicrobiales bacterium]